MLARMKKLTEEKRFAFAAAVKSRRELTSSVKGALIAERPRAHHRPYIGRIIKTSENDSDEISHGFIVCFWLAPNPLLSRLAAIPIKVPFHSIIGNRGIDEELIAPMESSRIEAHIWKEQNPKRSSGRATT
jgi:hypothetical protein